MNREILFRGKRLDNGEWVYGDLVTKYPHHKGLTIVENGRVYHEVDPETVGQYLGIADKNGDKVFQGDILKYTQVIYTDCSKTEIEEVREPAYIEIAHYHPMGSVVKPWTKGVRAFVWDTETGEGLTGKIESDEIEIIGNRWDNPDVVLLVCASYLWERVVEPGDRLEERGR